MPSIKLTEYQGTLLEVALISYAADCRSSVDGVEVHPFLRKSLRARAEALDAIREQIVGADVVVVRR